MGGVPPFHSPVNPETRWVVFLLAAFSCCFIFFPISLADWAVPYDSSGLDWEEATEAAIASGVDCWLVGRSVGWVGWRTTFGHGPDTRR